MEEHTIFHTYFSEDALFLAWERYIHSTKQEAKDYDGIRRFGNDLHSNIGSLSEWVLAEKFRPTRPFKFFEPKASGMQRSKSMLIIEDALIYQAIVNQVASQNFEQLVSS